jgi:hypothetical protein
MNETTPHILIECNYTEAVWNLVVDKIDLPMYSNLSVSDNPMDWVQSLVRTGSKRDRKKNLGVLITFWWLIWKERNREFLKP